MIRRKAILISAITSVAVCLVAPAAHGHGNNPKGDDKTRPDSPFPRVQQKPPPVFASGGFQRPPERFSNRVARRLGVTLDIDNTTRQGVTQLSLPSQSLTPPSDLDVTTSKTMRLEPVLRAANFNASLEDVFEDGFGRSSGPVVTTLAPQMIPAPGTLALLGIATLAVRARRRRRTSPV